MPRIKLSEVLSFTSEDPKHVANNLLNSQNYQKWKIHKDEVGKQCSITLKLERLSSISSIDIGNEGSAFVEVLVAREDEEYKILLAASSFMSPLESRNMTPLGRVRMFTKDKLSEETREQKWSKVKVVCSQPFNRNLQYGLSFLTVTCPDSNINNNSFNISLNEDNENNETDYTVGSLFAKKKALHQTKVPDAEEKLLIMPSPTGIKRKFKDVSNDDSISKKKEITTKIETTEAFKDRKKTNYVNESNKDYSKTIPKENYKLKTPKADSKQTFVRKTSKAAAVENKQLKTPKAKAEVAVTIKNTEKKNSVDNRRSIDITSAAKTNNRVPLRKYVPFSSLMHGVVYSLSGYKNPQRGNLRDKMTSMGAKYKPDWDKTCTHLICAFPNTPKYNEIKGKGIITKHTWIEDCFIFKKKITWKKHLVAAGDGSSGSDSDEVWAEDLKPKNSLAPKETQSTTFESLNTVDTNLPSTSKEVNQELCSESDSERGMGDTDEIDTDDEIHNAIQTTDGNADYDADTDEEDESKETDLPELLNIFEEKVFFIYGSPEGEACLKRYIIAYGGEVNEYMDSKVHYVITDSEWDTSFDQAKKLNKSLQFLKSKWIWQCSNESRLVAVDQFLVAPK